MKDSTSRRSFLHAVGLGTAALGLGGSALAQQKRAKGISKKKALVTCVPLFMMCAAG